MTNKQNDRVAEIVRIIHQHISSHGQVYGVYEVAQALAAFEEERYKGVVEACQNALGAYDALKIIGADAYLPGYDHCLERLKQALKSMEDKTGTGEGE